MLPGGQGEQHLLGEETQFEQQGVVQRGEVVGVGRLIGAEFRRRREVHRLVHTFQVQRLRDQSGDGVGHADGRRRPQR
ncbi:hypothetical protein ACPCAG_19390 [Streptomyces pseudogriseolus]|uniref:hypothetical protein n=1 Tax=Streptomyces pseudogriseolus TaxID=36817 RepID=UPI003FA2CE06